MEENQMKKLIALLLALMMVLVCTAALAEGGNENNPPAAGNGNGGTDSDTTTKVVSVDPATASTAAGTPTNEVTVKIKKSISAGDDDVYNKADRHPAVTLKFTAVQKSVELSTETTAPQVTFNDLTIGEDADYGELEINLPSYKAVGIYTYTVTETATGYAGMTEATNLELKVTVIQNTTTGNLEIGGIAVRQDNVKTDEIENIYKSGRVKVTKDVEGNMGDRTKAFPITITLNAPTDKTVASTVTYKVNGGDATAVTFTNGKAEVKVNLKHNDSVEIFNIPEGVTYTVVEDAAIKHVDSATDEQTNVNAYKVEGEVKDAATIAVGQRIEYVITNTKTINVDTGVALDFVPYVLIMALVLAGVALRIYRRRKEY
jgi:hypothetical protein